MTQRNGIRADVSYTDACAARKPASMGKTVYEEGDVFSNHSLLRIIFQNLSFGDLKSARQVSHQWNFEATRVLIVKFRTKTLEISNTSVTLVIDPLFKDDLSMSLPAFSEFVTKSTIFPLTISLKDLRDDLNPIEKTKLVNFLKLYGHNFMSLSLDLHQIFKEETRTFVEENLTQLFPNLKCLTVKGDLFSDPIGPKKFHLEKLKTIRFEGSGICSPFFSAILRMSKKLENIYYWRGNPYHENVEEDYKIFVEYNSLHLLRSVDLYFSNSSLKVLDDILSDGRMSNVKEITRLFLDRRCSSVSRIRPRGSCPPCPPLGMPMQGYNENFLPLDWAMVGRILTAFFQNHCKSLERISGLYRLGGIAADSLSIPVFPDVSRLDLCCGEYSSEQIPMLPNGVVLSTTFPCLSKISLDLRDVNDEILDPTILFPGDQNPLFTVQSLSVIHEFELETSWVEFVHRLFPNVVEAKFPALEDFNSASEFLWRFQCLKDFRFDLHLPFGEEAFPKYDSIFTGLSPETVETLYKTPSRDLEQLGTNEIEALRTRSSITNLQRLRKLRMGLIDHRKITEKVYHPGTKDSSGHENSPTDSQILSHITGRFAFMMCPKLLSNVKIYAVMAYRNSDGNPLSIEGAFRTLTPFVQPISYYNVSEYVLLLGPDQDE